jgi:hypothetical protein
MATLLDLQDTPFDNAKTALDIFFAHNAFQWEYDEDRIHLDALDPLFLERLKLVEDAILSYKGDMRFPLHIHIMNVEKAGIPFGPLREFFWKVIEKEYYFGNYNLHVFAKATSGEAVSINTLAICS